MPSDAPERATGQTVADCAVPHGFFGVGSTITFAGIIHIVALHKGKDLKLTSVT